jgi:hypothetical protein
VEENDYSIDRTPSLVHQGHRAPSLADTPGQSRATSRTTSLSVPNTSSSKKREMQAHTRSRTATLSMSSFSRNAPGDAPSIDHSLLNNKGDERSPTSPLPAAPPPGANLGGPVDDDYDSSDDDDDDDDSEDSDDGSARRLTYYEPGSTAIDARIDHHKNVLKTREHEQMLEWINFILSTKNVKALNLSTEWSDGVLFLLLIEAAFITTDERGNGGIKTKKAKEAAKAMSGWHRAPRHAYHSRC